MSAKHTISFSRLLWGLFPNGCHCSLLYKVQCLLVHEFQQRLFILFPTLLWGLVPNGCCSSTTYGLIQMYKRAKFNGDQSSVCQKMKFFLTLLWGMFPNCCHCLLFLLLYKVQFMLVQKGKQDPINVVLALLWGLFPNG